MSEKQVEKRPVPVEYQTEEEFRQVEERVMSEALSETLTEEEAEHWARLCEDRLVKRTGLRPVFLED